MKNLLLPILFKLLAILMFTTYSFAQVQSDSSRIDWEATANWAGVNEDVSSVIGYSTKIYRTMEALDYINKNTDWNEMSESTGMDESTCKILYNTAVINQRHNNNEGVKMATAGIFIVTAIFEAFKGYKTASIEPDSPNYAHFINHEMASYGKDTILTDEVIMGTVSYKTDKELKYLDIKGVENSINPSIVKAIKLNKLPSYNDKVSFKGTCYYKGGSVNERMDRLTLFVNQYFNQNKFTYTNKAKGKEKFSINLSNLNEDRDKGLISFNVKDDILLEWPGITVMTKDKILVRWELKYRVNIICVDNKIDIKIDDLRTFYPLFKPYQLLGDGRIYIEEVGSKGDNYYKPAYETDLSDKHYNIITAEEYNDTQCLCELSKKEATAKLKDCEPETKIKLQKKLKKCVKNKNNQNSQAINNIEQNINMTISKMFLSVVD